MSNVHPLTPISHRGRLPFYNNLLHLRSGQGLIAFAACVAVAATLVCAPATSYAQGDDEGGMSDDELMPDTADDADVVTGVAEELPEDSYRLGATPTFNAVTGLYHLTSAQTSDELTFRMAFFTQFFSGSDVVRANDENSRFIGTMGLSVTPVEWLEPYLVFSARSNSNSFSNPETVLAQGDTALGTKAIYPAAPAFYVGGELRLLFLTGANDTSFDFGGTSARIAALGTFDGTELPDPLPLKAHLNIGYFLDNSDQLLPEDADGRKIPPTRVERFAQNLSAYDRLDIGVGVELPFDYVTPSLEYNLGVLSGQEPAALCDDTQPLPCPSEAGFGGNPQIITLGVKGEPLQGLILNGAIDIGLTSKDVSGVPITAPYNIILGLSYVFDPRPKIVEVEKIVMQKEVIERKPKIGFVRGTVVDLDTADALAGATISYVGRSLTRQTTDPKDGSFESYEFEPDTEIEIEISHPDYEPQVLKPRLEEGENLVQIKLKPIGKTGVLAGNVKTDKGVPAIGSVILTGPKTYKVNLSEGAFSQKVLEGRYTVASTVSGYLTAGKDIVVKQGQNIKVDLNLSARPDTSVVTVTDNKLLVDGKIVFDKDDKPTPDALKVLDQLVSVMFEHPEFTRIRIEGHTDDKGPEKRRLESSQARAQAVMDYIKAKGVSPERLEAKGFGGEQPLVPNLSARNREINQRIAFTIVSKRSGK